MTTSLPATRSFPEPDSVVFEPIERETLSALIRDRLLDRIASGELEPGARMPSERLLSEQFRVARTSVREAMQGLLSLGVIERRGNRSYVAERLPDVRVGGADLDDRKQFVRQLFETRRALELPIIEMAARRASDADRTEIEALAKGFRPGMPLAEFRAADRAFHATIARACGNPLLVELYGKVLASLFRSDDFESLLFAEENRAEVERIISRSARHHALIAKAVARRDPVGAVEAGTRHLDAVERGMIDRLK
jgi:GntR family transcriptional regulator, transcriptional repressor for pyruvate dehydrogenase complex